MLFPVLIAYLYNESDLSGYFYSMALCLSISIPVWFLTRKNRKLSSRDGFALVTFAWIIVAIAGSLPFYLTGTIPNYTDAWFESMSGFTTTGATVIDSTTSPICVAVTDCIGSQPKSLLLWRSTTQWLGGMGVIMLSILEQVKNFNF